MTNVIPPRDPSTGCIPPGRYATDLHEVRREFVEPYTSSPPSRREILWEKFENYLIAWDEAQRAADVNLLLGLWISGSFITDKSEPDDIDLTVIYDGEALSALAGKPGAGRLKKLAGIRDREKQAKSHGIEVFPLPWRSVASSLHSEKLSWIDTQYFVKLGALDDFWQRKPPPVKAAPIAPLVKANRGYVEVMF